jgi:hypothetical protein
VTRRRDSSLQFVSLSFELLKMTSAVPTIKSLALCLSVHPFASNGFVLLLFVLFFSFLFFRAFFSKYEVEDVSYPH